MSNVDTQRKYEKHIFSALFCFVFVVAVNKVFIKRPEWLTTIASIYVVQGTRGRCCRDNNYLYEKEKTVLCYFITTTHFETLNADKIGGEENGEVKRMVTFIKMR